MGKYILGLLVIGASVFANTKPTYNFPILELNTQGNGKGVIKSTSCKIYDNYFTKEDLSKYLKLIQEASRAKVSKALHIMAANPTIKISANYPTRFPIDPVTTGIGPKNVLLFADGGSMETREGEAAKQLVNLVRETCK